MTIQPRLKTQSNDTNQNSAYTRQTKSSVETNSNMRFISSKDRYEITQHHHKQREKTKKFADTCVIKYFNLDFV